MDSIFPSIQKKGKVNWKGNTQLQVSSKIQKNDGNIAITDNNLQNIFLSRPLNNYRREIGENKICNPRTSNKIDEINRPNGYILNQTKDNNLDNVLDIQISNNENTDKNEVSKALQKVRSSSGVISNEYFTTNEQYYNNRDMNNNNQFEQGEPSFSNGNFMNQNIYSDTINTCRKYVISNALQNNYFHYYWIDGSHHEVKLLDGNYDIERLNNELKLIMIKNRHYYVNKSNQTKLFLLSIVYNTPNKKIQLQCFLNNTYSNKIIYSIPPVFLYIGHDTVNWNNDVSYNNILPTFDIPPSFSNVIGFTPGIYPSNPNSTTNYFVDSNMIMNIQPKSTIANYKPNNTQFSQQGPVSSGSLIARKKYDAITKTGMSLRTPDSMNLQNSLAYNIPIHGTIKNKFGEPLSLICNNPVKNIKCLKKQTQTSALISVFDIFPTQITPYNINIDFTHTDISYVSITITGGNISYTKYYSKNNTEIIPSTREITSNIKSIDLAYEYQGLLPDTSYSFVVVPYNYTLSLYNHYIVPGIQKNISFYTLSDVSNILIGNVSTYSVDISFNCTDLLYVIIEAYNGIFKESDLKEYKPFLNEIHYTNLLPNTNYSFGVIPYNHNEDTGFTIMSNTINTLSDVSNIKIENITATSMDLYFEHTDLSFILIERNLIEDNNILNSVINQYEKPLTIPIKQSGLSLDTGYQYKITPYNNESKPGITYLTNIQYTISSIENFFINRKYAYSFDINFDYTSFTKVHIKLSSEKNILEYDYIKPFSLPIHIYDLSADNLYNIEITPFNKVGLQGSTYFSDPIYTLSDLSNVTIGNIAAYSLDISFTYTDLSYVYIERIGGGMTKIDYYNKSILRMPIHYTGLLSGISYYFNVIPFNHFNQAGNAILSDTIYTLPDLSNVIITRKTENSMDLSFTFTDLSYVIITAFNENIQIGSNTYYKPFNNVISYNNLEPNKRYNFNVTPYNNVNKYGTTKTNNNNYTLSSVSNILLFNQTTTTIDISFVCSDLSYVIIKANNGNTMNNISNKKVSKPFGNITYNELSSDMSYSFTVIPYNNVNEEGTAVTSTDVLYTLSYVNNVRTSVKDSSSISITFGNSDLSYVKIEAIYGNNVSARIQNIYKPFTKPITYGGLLPDVSYTFLVTPYNHANVAGDVSGNSIAVYTWSYVNNVRTSVKDSSSVSITFGNSDLSYVTIKAIYGNSVQARIQNIYPPFSDPIVYGGLLADVSYTFAVTPYNNANIAGDICGNNIAVYTWSNVYNVRTSVKDSTSISIDFSNSDISYVKIRAIYGNSESARIENIYPPLNKPITYGGLLSDVSYTFEITPYNNIDVSGAVSGNNTTVYTWSYVNNVRTSVNDASSVSIEFGNSDLSYVTIKAIYGNSVTARIQNIYSPFTIPIVYGGLLSDVSYTFAVTPYNHANVAGDVSGNSIAVYTWSFVNNVRTSVKDSSSVNIRFGNSDLSYVSIKAIYGNSVQARIQNIYPPFSDPIVYGGLLADVSYTFAVTPYNHANVAGDVSGNSTAVYTWSYVNNVRTSVKDSSSVNIRFGNSDLSYVSIKAIYGNSVQARIQNIYPPFSDPIVYGGLLPDVSYTFDITPYNHIDVSGILSSNSTPVYTHSSVNNILLSSVTSTTIDISFGKSDLSYVSITANIGNTSSALGPNIYSRPINSNITFTGLTSDVSYSFNITPFNDAIIPVAGKSVISETVYTLSRISNVTLSNLKRNSIDINFDRSDLSYVSIIANIGNTASSIGPNIYSYPFSLPITFEGLTSDVSYSFNVTPYNHASRQGITVLSTTTEYTLSYIYSLSLSNPTSKTVDVNFGNSDLSYVFIKFIVGGYSDNQGNISNTYSKPLSLPIKFVGLSSGINYGVEVTAFNHVNRPSSKISDTIYTLSQLDEINVYNITPISMDISFSVLNVNYVTISANIGNTNNYVKLISIYNLIDFPNDNRYTFTELTAGNGYRFNVIPYNNQGTPGNPVLTPVYYTLSTANTVILSNPTTTSIDISFGRSDLSYVSIRANKVNTAIYIGPTIYYKNEFNNWLTFNNLNSGVNYNFIVTPYNDGGLPGTSVVSLSSLYTKTSVSNVLTSVKDSSSILIDFSNTNLSYVIIKAIYGNNVPARNVRVNYPISKPITYGELLADISYTFDVTPYNDIDVSSNSSGNLTAVYTWSYVNNVRTSVKDSTSVNIRFGNSDLSYVTIKAIYGNTVQARIENIYPPFSNPIVYGGLLADVSYTFDVIPYNHVNVPGAVSGNNTAVYTWSTVNNVRTSVRDSSSVNIRFGNSDLSYVSIKAIYGNSVQARIQNIYPPFSDPIVYGGLLADVSYTFAVTPYNHANVAGDVSGNSTAVYTWSFVNNVRTSVNDSSSVNIRFGNSDLSYVTIKAIYGNSVQARIQNIYPPFADPIVYGGLLADISYTFDITPYNHIDVSGILSSNSTPVYTHSSVNNILLSSVTSTTIDISFGKSDLSYVSITANIGNTSSALGPNIYSRPINSNITFTGLTSDVSYSFNITPFNDAIIPVAGKSVISETVYTLSRISNVTLSNLKRNSIDINFDRSDLSYVSIIANIGNTTSSIGPNIYSNPFSLPITFEGLTPDVSYSFNVTPYNHASRQGITVLSSTTEYTLSNIYSLTLTNPTSRSVDVNFSYSNLSYVFIKFIVGGFTDTEGNISETYYKPYSLPLSLPIKFERLSPGINYGVEVTAFNHANKPSSKISSTIYTLSQLNDVYVSNITPNSVDISFIALNVNYITVTANIGNTNATVVTNQYKIYSPFTREVTFGNLTADVSYSFNVIAYNRDDVPGPPILSPVFYTLSTVNTVILSNPTTTSIDISFGRSDLSYVYIMANIINTSNFVGPSIYYKNEFNNWLTFNNLNSGVNYNFTVTPYNHGGLRGTSVVSLSSLYTKTSVSNVLTSVKDSSSIFIDFSNTNLSYVIIKAIYGNSVTARNFRVYYPITTPITYGGLLADVSYTFDVTPYNDIDVSSNSSGNLTAVYTWSFVNNVRTSVRDSSSVNIRFGNSDLSYVTIKAIYGNSVQARIQNIYPPFSDPIVYGGLLADVSYTFAVTPYNHANVAGDICGNSIAVYTWSTVNNVRTSVRDSSSVNIRFGNSDLSYVSIKAIYGNSVQARIQNIYPPFSDPIVYGGLLADVSYTFAVTPYNHANVAGDVSGNLTAVYTWSTVSNVRTSVNDSSSVNIRFGNSDLSYVTIKAIYGNSVQARIQNIYPPFADPIVYGGLLADISYTFDVTPYNHIDVSGILSSNSTPVYTHSSVNNILLSSVTSTTIDISFGKSDLSYVSITANIGNTSSALGPNIYSRPINSNITFTGLTSDVSYSFNITPFNDAIIPVAGKSVISETVYTLSRISNVTLSNLKRNSIDINFDRSDLSYVSIIANIGNTASSIGPNIYSYPFSLPITFEGLTPDVSYSFNVTPYNHASKKGITVLSSTTEYTLSYIYSLSLTNPTSRTVNVNFSYSDLSYVYIKFIVGGFSGTTYLSDKYYKLSSLPLTLPIVFGGLSPGINYGVEVTAFNHVDNPSTIISSSIYTLSQINDIFITNITPNSMDISFTAISVNYIKITANIGNTNNIVVTDQYQINSPFSNQITFGNLTADVSYSFNVIAYNNDNKPGPPLLSPFYYTLSTVNTVVILSNPTETTIDISFGCSDLLYVKVYANNGMTNNMFSNIDFIKPFLTPIRYSGLSNDVSYSFTVVPYNHGGFPGTAVTSQNAIYTLSKITSITVSSTRYAYGMDVSFVISDISYVTIAVNGGTATRYLKQDVVSSNYIHISNLAANNSYSLSIIPYNHIGNAGATSVSTPYTTAYDVTNYRTVGLSGDRIDISFGTASDVSYIKITRLNGVNSNVTNYQNLPFTTIQQSGLSPDTSYNFTLTPYNVYNISGGNQDITNKYTLSTISSITIGANAYAYGMDVSFVHSDLSYVTIQANVSGSPLLNFTKAQLITANVQIANLAANTSYSLNIIPYNHLGNAGATSVSTAYRTVNDVTNYRTVDISADRIDISFSTASDVSSVKIRIVGGGIDVETPYQKPFSTYTKSGLIPDKSYNFTLTPYNVYNISGEYQVLTNKYTLSNVSGVYALVNNTNSLLIYFGNSDLSYVTIQANVGSTNTPFGTANIYSRPFTTPITFNGLSTDVSYSFVVTPYNDVNVAGVPQGNVTAVYTKSFVNNVSYSVKDSRSINISFGNSDLSYVSIQANIGSTTNLYRTANIYSKPFTTPILFRGLQPDVSYTFNVTPYNDVNVAGITVINATAEYTWSDVSGVYALVNDISSIKVYFGNSDLSYVTIQANVGSTNTPFGTANTYSRPFTTPITFNGLSPDVSYSFVVTPYNNVNVQGTPIGNITAVYTKSFVNNVRYEVNDTSSIKIYFGNSDLSYVSIKAKYGTTTITTANIYSKPFTTPILFRGLQPDVSYTFNVTPYNDANVAGVTVGNDTVEYTLTTFFNLFIPLEGILSDTIDLSFTSAIDFSYASISINNNPAIKYFRSNYYNTPIRITGLISGVSYTFKVTPYNHKDISNTTLILDTPESIGYPGTRYSINNTFVMNYSKLDILIRNNPPWGIYDASMWDPVSNTLREVRGITARDASGTNITAGRSSGNGANTPISYIGGGTTSTLSWPSGSIPTKFTICSITRYSNGSTTGKILSSNDLTFVHGHNNGFAGIVDYGSTSKSNTQITPITNWLVCCGKNNLEADNVGSSTDTVLLNGFLNGDAYGGSGNGTLSINKSGNPSDWNFTYMMIWDSVLSVNDMTTVSNALLKYLYTGKMYRSIGSGLITTLPSISNVIFSNITYNSVDISFNYSDYISYFEIGYAGIVNENKNPLIVNNLNIQFPITFSDLSSNKSYDFYINPYNIIGERGAQSFSNSYTTSYVNNVRYLINDSSSILIDFSNSDLSYVSIQANVGSTTTLFGTANIYSKPLILTKPVLFRGLIPGRSYTFNVTPYNNVGVSGTTQGNSTAIYTKSSITSITIGANPYAYSMDLSFVHSDLSYVTIQPNITGCTVAGPLLVYTNSQLMTENVVIPNLMVNTSYTVNIIPYNYSEVAGDSKTSTTTYSTTNDITNLRAIGLSGDRIDISFAAASDVSSVQINITGGTTGSQVQQKPFSTISYTDLTPGTSYNISVNPYNIYGRSYTATAINKYTYSTISNITLSNPTYDSVDISFTQTSNFSKIYIQAYLESTYVSDLTVNSPITSSITYNTGLEDNTPYSFKISAYNHENVQGSIVTSGIIRTTIRPIQFNMVVPRFLGNKILATTSKRKLYSSIDSGLNWNYFTATDISSTVITDNVCVAADSIGQKIALSYSGNTYFSIDSGSTWTNRTNATGKNWVSLVSDSTGNKLAAVAPYNGIYVSVDSGVNWTKPTTPAFGSINSLGWSEVASSSDGKYLVACNSNYIYTSSNYGLNWTARHTNIAWSAVSSDSTGKYLAAYASAVFNMFTSSDYGVNWTANAPLLTIRCNKIASDSTGQYLVACGSYGFTSVGTKYNIYTSNNYGASWTARDSTRFWKSVASDSTGQYLVACSYYIAQQSIPTGQIYTSNNYGVSWSPRESDRNWISVASNSTGQYLVACVRDGQIYTSNNYGVSWSPRMTDANRSWNSLASDSTGQYLVASTGSTTGRIYTSDNYGENWIARDSQRNWLSVASDSTGQYLVASSTGTTTGIMFTSRDYGVTWTSTPQPNWKSITNSSNGTKLAACAYNFQIYTSLDSGTSWTARESVRNWNSIASSSDGTILVACVENGLIYTSFDSGVTWIGRATDLSRNWVSVAVSPSGIIMSACEYNGKIYTSTDKGVTWTVETNSNIDTWKSVSITADTELTSSNSLFVCAVSYSGNKFSVLIPTISGVSMSNQGYDTVDINFTITSIYSYIYIQAYTGTTFVSDLSFSIPNISSITYNKGLQDETPYYFKISAYLENIQSTIITTDNITTLKSPLQFNMVVPRFINNTILATSSIRKLYSSTDSGVNWNYFREFEKSNMVITGNVCVASNSTGGNIVLSYSGNTYFSSNSGSTWTSRTSATGNVWVSLVSDSSGIKLAAVAPYYGIYNSVNSGSTWTKQTTPVFGSALANWRSVTSSSDGRKLAACVNAGLMYTSTDYGINWIGRNSSRVWISVASSSDGNSLVACVYGGQLYISTDSGANWTAKETNRLWYSVASDSTGQKLAACSNVYNNVAGQVYISDNGGASWYQSTNTTSLNFYSVASNSSGSKLVACAKDNYLFIYDKVNNSWATKMNDATRAWKTVASNSTGQYLFAGAQGNYIYISSNFGNDWYYRGTVKDWISIASNSTGQYLVACAENNSIFTSNDYGENWIEVRNSINNWNSVTSDSTGQYLTACVRSSATNIDKIYTSRNYGVTWTNSPQPNWKSITNSSNGTKLAACAYNFQIYTSLDSGNNWTARDSVRNWNSIASSSDGTILAACVENGLIYTSFDSGVTWIGRATDLSRNWVSVAVSQNGFGMAACEYNGQIYTSVDKGVTWTVETNSNIDTWKSVSITADTELTSSNSLFVCAVSYSGNTFRKTMVPTLSNLFIDNITSTSLKINFVKTDVSMIDMSINNLTTNTKTSNFVYNPISPINISGLTVCNNYSFTLKPISIMGISLPITFNTNNIPLFNTNIISIINSKPPWGIYDAAMWNPTTKILPEARGNGRNVTSTGTITFGLASGNRSIPYIGGLSNNGTLTWPSGSIPANFTICSITRYSGSTYGRIFNGNTTNFVHGHWSGKRGIAYYGDTTGWKTQYNESIGTQKDWLVFCGNNGTSVANSILIDSVASGIASGGAGNDNLNINIGNNYNEFSDWQFSYLMIWDQVLTDSEMLTVSNALNTYLSTGYSPIYTLSTVNSLVSTNITTDRIDINFTNSDLSYVIIESNPRILTGVNTTPQTISKNSISLPIIYTGLTNNQSYYFKITPYNYTNLMGDFLGNTFTTLPCSLYDLSVTTNNISVNSITINYQHSKASYVIVHIIGSSGYISSQPQYNVTSNPVTQTITGLNTNTYYNFVLVPYIINNIPGSSFYFTGLSTFTSGSTPINYSIVGAPLCTSANVSISSSSTSPENTVLSNECVITITLTGSFKNIAVYLNDEFKLTQTTTTITFTGLTRSTAYTTRIIPYNNIDIPGVQASITITTNIQPKKWNIGSL